jgi:hypothetical protein
MLPIQYLSLKREKKIQFYFKVGKWFFSQTKEYRYVTEVFLFYHNLCEILHQKKRGAGSNI